MSRKLPLYFVLVIQFTAQILGITGLVGYLSYRSGKQAVQKMVDQLITEAGTSVTNELDHYLETAQKLNQTNIAALEAGIISVENLDQLHRYLIGEHRAYPEVTGLMFGDRQGNFRIIHRVSAGEFQNDITQLQTGDLPLEAGRSNPQDPSQVDLFAVQASGELGRKLPIPLRNLDVRDRPWYQKAVATGQAGWSEPFQIGETNVLTINAFAPFFDKQQQLQGVFSVNLSLENLSHFLESLPMGQHGQIFILERNGLLLADSSTETPYLFTPITVDPLAQKQPGMIQFRRLSALESENLAVKAAAQELMDRFGNLNHIREMQNLTISVDGDRHFLEVIPYRNEAGLDLLLVSLVPEMDFMAAIYQNTQRTFLLCAVALLGSLGLALLTARRIGRSLSQLTQDAQNIAAGDLNYVPITSSITEIQTLAESFEAMVVSLEEAAKLRQNYTQDLEREVATKTAALRKAYRLARIGNWELSLPEEELHWSEEMFALFGLEPTQNKLDRDELAKLIHPDDREILIQKRQRAIADKQSYSIDYRVLGADGSVHYHEGRTEVDCNAAGEVTRLFGTVIDITDRKILELALTESETRLRDIFNSVPAGISRTQVFADGTWNNLQVSAGCEIVSGYTADELVSDPALWVQRIYPEDWQEIQPKIFADIFAERSNTYEYRFLDRQDQVRWIAQSHHSRWDPDKGCWYVTFVSIDISDRKRTEIQLEIATEELDNFFSLALDLLCIVDLEGHFLRFNHQWEVTLGYPMEVIESSSFLAYVHPDDLLRTNAAFASLQQNHVLTNFANRYVHQDGSLLWLEWRAVVNGDVTYAAARDISASKQVELELIHARDAAESAAIAKGLFLATMSHEIRTPMNGVIGMLNLLKDTPLNEEQQTQVAIAQSSAESLLSLINDILDFSKVDAGKLNLEFLTFDLHAQIGEFAKAIALKAQEKNLELILDLREVAPVSVIGDAGRLRQILTNLVGNAIKFTHQGEIVIRCHLQPQGEKWLFTCQVEDTGIGIPPEKLSGLFEPFTQLDASTTRNYGGTGLGLAIVKKLCHLMDGEVRAASEVGRGSRFEFSLQFEPCLIASPQTLPPLPDTAHVLLVEDNAATCAVLRQQLEAWGVTVAIAPDGVSALAYCAALQHSEQKLDLLILDYALPDQSGTQLHQALIAQGLPETLPCVLMSELRDAPLTKTFKGQAYLIKPILPSELRAIFSLLATEPSSDATVLFPNKRSPDPTIPTFPTNVRLLMVEDTKINQLVLKGLLNRLNLEVDLALHGLEALAILRETTAENPYALILMDCLMPEMDGYETTKQIRAGHAGDHYREVPIIALTANAMKGDREKCLLAGMNDYVSKPIIPEKLVAVLEKWLQHPTTFTTAERISQTYLETKHYCFDPNKLMFYLGKDNIDLDNLCRSFISETMIKITAMEADLVSQSFEDLYRHAHSIKGIADMFGATQLGTTAIALEDAIRSQVDQPTIAEKLELLKQAFQQSQTEVENWLEERNPSPAIDANFHEA